MRTILLVRHAESVSASSQSDKDRSLTGRGEEDAPGLGTFLKSKGYVPNHIFCSTARRARQTCEKISERFSISESGISWNNKLYSGSAHDYLSMIQQATDKDRSIMIIGHNPRLERVVSLLCSREGKVNIAIQQGGVVCIEHPALKCKQVKPGTGRLRWMISPGIIK